MSVSQSSVYEQTESLKQIEEKIDYALNNENNLQAIIEDIVMDACNLTMAENYRLIAILSKNINSNSSVFRKFIALRLIKELMLTALHHYYIFISVKALPIISQLTQFEGKKSQFERAKLYIRQLSLKGNGDEVVQQRQCYKLFTFANEFIYWFSSNIPTHINAQYQFRSTFARAYEQLQFHRQIKSYEYFKDSQLTNFYKKFTKNKSLNIELIKQLIQFINIQIRSAIDQRKYKSQLLIGLVHTSDSYCVKGIIIEICGLIQDSNKLFYCLKFVQMLMNVAEIQFIQLTKLYVVPAIVNYIIPHRSTDKKFSISQISSCSEMQEKLIIDCICIWNKITQQVGLSTQLYKIIIQQIAKQKKTLLNVQSKHLNEFLTNLVDMKGVNSQKKIYIMQPYIQKQVITQLNNKLTKSNKTNQQLDGTVINKLDSLKQSCFQYYGKIGKQSSNEQSLTMINQQCNLKPNINTSRKTNSKKGVSVVGNQKNIITFQEIDNGGNEQYSSKGKISFVTSNNNQVEPSLKDCSVSKGMKILSKLSEGSSNKFKEESNNIVFQNQNLKSSIPNPSSRQSGSVVYFDHSQDFHSETSIKNKQKDLQNSLSSAQSLQKDQFHEKQSEMSTYKFEPSAISKSSLTSSIHNFGKSNTNFPETVSKPIFGFKKKDVLQQIQHNSLNSDDLRIILPNDAYMINNNQQILNKQKNRINKYKSQSIHESEIQDLSGGKHLFDKSINSPFEQNDIKNKKNRKQYRGQMRQEIYQLAPRNQYYQHQIETNKGKFYNKNKQQQLRQNQVLYGGKKIYPNKGLLQGDYFEKQGNQSKNPKKKVQIIDQFCNDRLLGLEKQLGRAMQQKMEKELQLKKKQSECKVIKSSSVPYMGKKMQNLKKQNEIIKILAEQKNKQDYVTNAQQFIKPINSRNRITDYFLQNKIRGTYTPQVQSFDRAFKKQILGSRCLLIANQNLQLGYNYSSRQNQISLYLTFLKVFDQVRLKVIQNSLLLEKDVNLSLTDQPAGYQLKIKRKVKGILNYKKQPTFSSIINNKGYKFPSIQIVVSGLEGQNKMQALMPCSVFNLTEAVEIDMKIIDGLKGKQALRTQPMPLCYEFCKNYKEKIDKYFPLHMSLVEGWKLVGFRFPSSIFGESKDQFFKFRVINSKFIQIQFLGNQKSLLAETLTCLLTKSQH